MIEGFSFLVLLAFIVLFLLQGQLDFFSPVSFFCYWGVGYYSLSPILSSYLLGYQFDAHTLFLVFFAIISILFSYYISRPLKIRTGSLGLLGRKIVARRVFYIFILGIFLLVFYIYKFYGGFSFNVFSKGHEFRFFLSNDGRALAFFFIVKSLFVLPFIYFSFLLSRGYKLGFVNAMYFPIALSISLMLGSKGVFLSVVLNGIILYNFYVKRFSFFSVTIAASILLALLLIFYYVAGLGSFSNVPILLVLGSILVSRLDVIRNLDLFVRETLQGDLIPEFFYSFYALPLQYIPRSLFSEKPFMFSPEMTRLLRYEVFADGVTYDFSAIAESIYNFGWLGVLLPGFIVGFVLKQLQSYYRRGEPFLAFSFVYLFFLGLPMSLMSSGFIASSSIVFLPINILLCIGIYYICFKKSKSRNA